MPTLIRLITEDDLHFVLGSAKWCFENLPNYAQLEPDWVQIMNLFHACCDFSNDDMQCFVYEEDGEPVGMMFAYLDTPMMAEGVVACEGLNYVSPDHNGAWIMRKMVSAFERWADEVKARMMIAGVSSGLNTDRVGRLYRLIGYTPSGITLAKQTPCWSDIDG